MGDSLQLFLIMFCLFTGLRAWRYLRFRRASAEERFAVIGIAAFFAMLPILVAYIKVRFAVVDIAFVDIAGILAGYFGIDFILWTADVIREGFGRLFGRLRAAIAPKVPLVVGGVILLALYYTGNAALAGSLLALGVACFGFYILVAQPYRRKKGNKT